MPYISEGEYSGLVNDCVRAEARISDLERERDQARDLLDSNVSSMGAQLAALGRERDELERRLNEVWPVTATEPMIEAACEGMYGKNWNGPDDKRPGQKMKDVWRNYARSAYAGFRRAAAVAEAGGEG